MRFHVDLVNLRWKDSCLGAADYSQMSQSTPQEKKKKQKQPSYFLPSRNESCTIDAWRTCTGQRSSHESHIGELYLNMDFFFPWNSSYPRGIGLGPPQRSRIPWNVGVVWVESIFSGCFQDSCIRLMGLTVSLV